MFVIIAGAGVLGREVARTMVSHKHDVVVVDIDSDVCEQLYAELGVVCVNRSATDLHTLEDAGARRADLLLTLMHGDADNIACALIGNSLGVPRIIARLRDPSYEAAYKAAGVTHIVRATQVLQSQIVLAAELPAVQEIMSLRDDAVRIVSVQMPDDAWAIGRSVQEIARHRRFPRECLLLGLLREGAANLIIPRGSDAIERRDTVLLIADADHVPTVTDLLTGKG